MDTNRKGCAMLNIKADFSVNPRYESSQIQVMKDRLHGQNNYAICVIDDQGEVIGSIVPELAVDQSKKLIDTLYSISTKPRYIAAYLHGEQERLSPVGFLACPSFDD